MAKTKRSIKWVKEKKNSAVSTQQKYAGIHLIAEFWSGKIIEDPKKVERILIGAVRAAKSTPLKIDIHKFSPQGLTGVVLLAESHLSIHTWPEIDYIAVDIFTCGRKSAPYEALDYLKKIYLPKRVKIKIIKRGKIL